MCCFAQRDGELALIIEGCGGENQRSPHAPRGKGKTLIPFGVLPRLTINRMVYAVLTSSPQRVPGYRSSVDRDGLWVYRLTEDGLIGLTAPSLSEARGIADSLAVVSHVAECNDECNEWELLKKGNHD